MLQTKAKNSGFTSTVEPSPSQNLTCVIDYTQLHATTRNYNNYHITVLICVVLHKSIYNIRFSDDDDDDDDDDEDDYD